MKPFYTRTRCVVGVLLVFLLPFAALAQPTNDQCANAITLNSGLTCVNTTGSLQSASGGATQTAGINAACGGLLPLLMCGIFLQHRPPLQPLPLVLWVG